MAVLVGQPAPEFSVTAVQGSEIIEEFTLSQFRGEKYVVLFFYPLDFTFVCPTELHEFQQRLAEFEELDTQLIGASTDSWYSHAAWLQTPKNQGGIEGVSYPILADFNKTVARDYDVLLPGGMALRGTFIIDQEGVVQHESINNLPHGRSVEEVLRMVKVIQFVEKHGEVCPANWQEGQAGMAPTAAGTAAYLSSK